MKRFAVAAWVAVFVAIALALPSVAAACPNCIGSSNRNTTVLKLVGAFMLVPFGVLYTVVRVVRSSDRDTDEPN